MAGVEVTITGMLYDKLNRTSQNVVLIGEATLTGVGIGGGPIVPPQQPPGGGGGLPIPPVDPGYGIPLPPDFKPPGIWPSPGHPAHPIAPGGQPPGIWGGANEPFPTPPIYFPPQVPPDLQPPEPPPPGTVTPVPPPGDQAGWPVQPITPPAYMVVWYPGVGPLYVTPPASATPSS